MTEALAAIDQFVAARLPRLHAPGVAIGLTDRERTLGFVCRGLADLASGTPVNPDTRFQIGSISKSFAAAVLLQEHEAGRVDLHAPVTEYVPWFSVRSRSGPIALHHLLSHTSGLIMGSELSGDGRHAVWMLRETATGFAPGEHFLYSNDGYKLVGLTLEALSGRPAHELVAERVVGPLGMNDTETVIRRDASLPVATGYQRECDDRPVHAGRPLIEAPRIESGTVDGSIVSSAAEMLAYARLILNRGAIAAVDLARAGTRQGNDAGGDSGVRGRVLSEESYRLWTSQVVEDHDEPGSFYGYGLVTRTLDGFECVGHSGGMVGFNTLLVCEPQTGLGVIVLLNGLDDRMEIARYALRAVRAAGAGAPVPPPPPPADPTLLGDEGAAEYAGVYAGEDGALEFLARDGRLMLRTGPEPDVGIVLERRGDDVFLAPDPAWDAFHLRFERDDGGAVVALSYGAAWYGRAGRAAPPAPAPDPSWATLVGGYRSHNPWLPTMRVVERRGRLLLIAPWQYPSDELELTRQPDGDFRVGPHDWCPDRVSFDTVIDGCATRAVYNGQPFFRTFT
ncbi:MAG TPA: serine hydrolase domain-containing protein [Thermoleophilia bacterium]|nr:serine hydrolase domain-containing protein [Thermoleophilia bacterium]